MPAALAFSQAARVLLFICPMRALDVAVAPSLPFEA
jgi:hypothetical protein